MIITAGEPQHFFIDRYGWFAAEPIKLTLAEAVRMQAVLYHSFAVWYATGEVTGRMFEPELSWQVGDRLSGMVTTTGESSLSVSP